MNENLLAWCSLMRAPGVGSKTFLKILTAFSTPQNFYQASEDEFLARLPSCTPEQFEAWREHPFAGEKDLAWLESSTANHIITIHDDRYPQILRRIDDPPPILFIKGDLENFELQQLAVVGSRKASPLALQQTELLCEQISANKIGITSGLALGVDAAAHRGALKSSGRTIAVVATGLDRVYPPQHRDLAYEILDKGGAFISELYTGIGIRSENFPRRNRLISGISFGVLVMEATENSGSLITAENAFKQGRDTFVMQTSNPSGRGAYELVKQSKARLVDAEMLFQLISKNIERPLNIPLQTEKKAVIDDALSATEAQILDAMGFEPCTIDDVVERTKIPVSEVSSTVLVLEINGYLTTASGGYLQRLV